MNHSTSRALLLATALLAALPAHAEIELYKSPKLSTYGDFRFRVETDHNSQNSDGTMRTDRRRARIRVRLGLNLNVVEPVTFGVRARTGARESQQGPHITLFQSGTDRQGDKQVVLDRWFAQFKEGRAQVILGKYDWPFWWQNDMFWGMDVNPAGISGRYTFDFGEKRELTLNSGYFSAPDDSATKINALDKGRVTGGQAVYVTPAGPFEITTAGGFFAILDHEGVTNPALVDRDYGVAVGNIKVMHPVAGMPLAFGFDYMRNTESYTGFNDDQRTGIVASVKYGQLKAAGEWMAGLYYARIEKFATVPFFAQNDWVRWGTDNQTRGTNIEGVEFTAAYAFTPNLNLLTRMFTVNGVTRESATSRALESGDRVRLDLNWKF